MHTLLSFFSLSLSFSLSPSHIQTLFLSFFRSHALSISSAKKSLREINVELSFAQLKAFTSIKEENIIIFHFNLQEVFDQCKRENTKKLKQSLKNGSIANSGNHSHLEEHCSSGEE